MNKRLFLQELPAIAEETHVCYCLLGDSTIKPDEVINNVTADVIIVILPLSRLVDMEGTQKACADKHVSIQHLARF